MPRVVRIEPRDKSHAGREARVAAEAMPEVDARVAMMQALIPLGLEGTAAPWHRFGTKRDRVARGETQLRGLSGAERGTRTRDLPITNRLLYQLS